MSGVQSGTIDVVRLADDDLSSLEAEVTEVVGMAVLFDEFLSFPVCELAD